MQMKLALFDDKNMESDIAKCCEENEATYVPIMDNRFGILSNNLAIDYTDQDNIDFRLFIKIYQCALYEHKKNHLFHFFKSSSPYSGKILDNLFFKNIIKYCVTNNIRINFIRILSDFKSEYTIRDAEEIQEVISDKNNIIKKLSLVLSNKTIIFDKAGYIDFSFKIDFYNKNKNTILNIIRTGFGE